MVALAVNIKDGVVLFHVWLIKPSLQVQGHVKEIHSFLIDSNKIQGEAIVLEYPVNLLSEFLSDSGC